MQVAPPVATEGFFNYINWRATNMTSIEKLIATASFLADKKVELKKSGQVESSLCTRYDSEKLTCIEHVYNESSAICRAGDYVSFDEIWYRIDEDYDYGSFVPCAHCQNVRDLKKQRMNTCRKLGHVHGQITKLGRKYRHLLESN